MPLFRGLRYERLEFPLAELRHQITAFAFIPGYQVHRATEHDPANLKAVGLMARLHDTLTEGGYAGHDLERLLVRILFCLFAEDTGIFDPGAFALYIENRTQRDGSDIGVRLAHLFQVLDTPSERRQRNLDDALAPLPYVNGQLFSEQLAFAEFNTDQREALLLCTRFDWSRISPAIFGALFQEVIKGARRQIGAHYTSERDILKVIRPLFLDRLRDELESARADRSGRGPRRLSDLRHELSTLRFFDPACGCGNFLVIAYRELRKLELDILLEQHGRQQALSLDEVNRLSTIDVNQFYGVEISEWPVRIAEVALWLMDHQSNIRIHEAFGQPFLRLPLRNSPHIRYGNALQMNWEDLLPRNQCSYILGNPPFVGHHYQNEQQKADQQLVMRDIPARGVLDYVCNWYVKAAEYISGTSCSVAFVSTNSICQGEQAGILWTELFSRYKIKITFAYQTFAWESEARGRAHVHVVIVGFSHDAPAAKLIFQTADDALVRTTADNISPYLVPGPDRAFLPIRRPICDVPQMFWGNKPTDGGHLILNEEERQALLEEEPEAAPFVRRYMSGGDFIDNNVRYCLWLVNATPAQLRRMPAVRTRLEAVSTFRQQSKAPTTRAYANRPALFRQISQPEATYLAIPEVSSERRAYIPMAMLSPKIICSNKIQFIPNASVYQFGILTSAMHMAWTKRICGRLKSDFSYSNSLVYNNFPWPTQASDSQKTRVVERAQTVLDVRMHYQDSTLGELYDPLFMPADLLKAHQHLDRSVERCYRREPFTSDQSRLEHLFTQYEQMAAPLLPRRRKGRAAQLDN